MAREPRCGQHQASRVFMLHTVGRQIVGSDSLDHLATLHHHQLIAQVAIKTARDTGKEQLEIGRAHV